MVQPARALIVVNQSSTVLPWCPFCELQAAQKCFVQSLAAYSIITYILQIKDRHNGNLMIDNKGHLIHIDFGFVFTNSPGGNSKFENAPFKLTSEFVEV
jgi:phosphatidylinositol kinase/protein kinase (PI-3  family)